MKRKSRKKKEYKLLKPILAVTLFYFCFISFFYLSLNSALPRGCSTHQFRDEQTGQCLDYSVKYPLIQRGNPAVEHCIDNDGVVKQELSENGEKVGNCLFLEGKSCEIWSFFNGKCGK